MIVAGEVSGDMHAAPVIEKLRQARPDLHVWGIGGDRLRQAGVELLYDVREMAVLGLWEVLKRYPFFRRVFRDTVRQMEERRPDAILLIDYPGFNLRLAAEAHKRGIKVLYYVCPQVWAWHRSRIPKMAAMIDRLMVIFPFEVDVFAGTDLQVDYVGHPLVEGAAQARAAAPLSLPWADAAGARVALLPGSRRQEVERILPVMLETAAEIERARPDTRFVIAAASEGIAAVIDAVRSATQKQPVRCDLVTGQTREVLRQARAAMVASGTATIETALMGCPMIVVYRTAAMTAWIGKRVIQVPHLGMVNIVAQERVCPEFIQHEARADAMATALMPLLDDTPSRQKMVMALDRVAAALGQGSPEERVAAIVEEELGR
jgi:lipid-A-disaccharide synthase